MSAGQLVGPPLWSTLKYVNNYLKICADIHGAQRMNPDDFGDPLTFLLVRQAGQIVHFHVFCEMYENVLVGLP